MTSLATQLIRLSAPQTDLLKESGRRDSLLFEPNVAAAQDAKTILQLGLSGLLELVDLNPQLSEFSESLFSESSSQMQRAVMNKTENKKLNRIIDKFLFMITPYMQLSASHKAFEWLIFRFRIQEYNVSSVIRCILPFYESNIFARIIHIVKIEQNDINWAWLYLHHKCGVPATRQQVLNHCISDVNFVAFICDTIIMLQETLGDEIAAKLGIYYSFYASILCGVIENTKKVNDLLVSSLMSCITLGIKSKLSPFCSATCVVVCQLCLSAQLSPIVVNSLCALFLQKISPGNVRAYLSTVLVICQTQGSAFILKSSALKKISKRFESLSLVDHLCKLDEETDLSPLIDPLIASLTPIGCNLNDQSGEDCRKFVLQLVTHIRIKDKTAGEVFSCLMNNMVDLSSSDETEFQNAWGPVCLSIGKSNVLALDQALSSNLPSKCRQSLLLMCNQSAKSGVESVSSFCSPDAGHRLLSMERILQISHNLDELPEDTCNIIVSALFDQSSDVVIFVLEHLHEIPLANDILVSLLTISSNLPTDGNEKLLKISLLSLKCLNLFPIETLDDSMQRRCVNALINALLWGRDQTKIIEIVKNSKLLSFVGLQEHLKDIWSNGASLTNVERCKKIINGFVDWSCDRESTLNLKKIDLLLNVGLKMCVIATSLQRCVKGVAPLLPLVVQATYSFLQNNIIEDMNFEGLYSLLWRICISCKPQCVCRRQVWCMTT